MSCHSDKFPPSGRYDSKIGGGVQPIAIQAESVCHFDQRGAPIVKNANVERVTGRGVVAEALYH